MNAPRAATRVVALRYLGFQVPGWIVAGGVLLVAVEWWELSLPLAAALFGLFVLKDAVLFPFVRRAYEPRSGGGASALVGRRAVARDPLAPRGYVRLGAELWAAELLGEGQVPAGTPLRVVEVRGLTLLVEPAAEEEPS